MTGTFSPYCNSEHILARSDADAPRPGRRCGPRTRDASFRSTARHEFCHGEPDATGLSRMPITGPYTLPINPAEIRQSQRGRERASSRRKGSGLEIYRYKGHFVLSRVGHAHNVSKEAAKRREFITPLGGDDPRAIAVRARSMSPVSRHRYDFHGTSA